MCKLEREAGVLVTDVAVEAMVGRFTFKMEERAITRESKQPLSVGKGEESWVKVPTL